LNNFFVIFITSIKGVFLMSANIVLKEGQVRAISDNILKRHGDCWKIHLSVKPNNHKIVYGWLFDEHNCPYGWKYGYADQKSKDFTIYVGSYDDVLAFSSKIVRQLGDYLEEPTSDTLWCDVRIFPKIAARFSVHGSDFTKYGFLGIPSLKATANILNPTIRKSKSSEERFNAYKQLVDKSHDFLRRAYGVYYYGSGEDFVKRFVAPFLNDEIFNSNVSWHLRYAKNYALPI
jgi:hypothetical protein